MRLASLCVLLSASLALGAEEAARVVKRSILPGTHSTIVVAVRMMNVRQPH